MKATYTVSMMDGVQADLVPLTEDKLDEVSFLVAQAFLHSPIYSYIFEGLDETRRLEALTWLFRKNFYLRLSEGNCKCGFNNAPDNKPEMVCAFIMQPPGISPITSWVMVRNGILYLPLRYGFRALYRLLEVIAHYDENAGAIYKANPNVSFSSVERMVVKPNFQGKGFGSRFLSQAIAAEEKKGRAVFLTTQEFRNVVFYQRLGFKVLHEGASFSSATDWTMARMPVGLDIVANVPQRMPSVTKSRRPTRTSINSGLALGVLATAFIAALLFSPRNAGSSLR